MEIDEKLFANILEIKKAKQLDFFLHYDNKVYPLENVKIVKSNIPVTKPTTRGGSYFSGVSAFKIKANTNELSLIPLLSQSMLGPNTEFRELEVKTKIPFNDEIKKITFYTYLTNSMQSPNHLELNLTIIRTNVE